MSPTRTLLLVGDEEHILSSLKRMLRRDGYAIVTADSQGKIIAWNRQAERTFGWSREEVLHRELQTETILPPGQRGEPADSLRQVFATGGRAGLEPAHGVDHAA